jgi:hypothetical protein
LNINLAIQTGEGRDSQRTLSRTLRADENGLDAKDTAMGISLQLGQKFILQHSHLHLRQVQVSFILALG